MEKIIKILEKIRIGNPDPSSYAINLYNIIESKILNDSIKEIYIEKMLDQMSDNKKDDIVVSNKNFKKEIKKNNHVFSSSTILLMTFVGSMLMLIMSSIFLGNHPLSKILLNTSFVILFISFLVPLFLIKKGVEKNTQDIKNRILEIKEKITEEEYKEKIISATSSIVEDIEKISNYNLEKKLLKSHVILLQSTFEKECKQDFYEKLAFIEKDIKNKMIIKKDLNNDLLKVKIPTYMK